jgi:hypothetical protein
VSSVILDNEAVQALLSPRHRKHREVLANIEAAEVRRRRRSTPAVVIAPTTVRVEAGWDRTSARSASVYRLRIADRPLDPGDADIAAWIRSTTKRAWLTPTSVRPSPRWAQSTLWS